MKDTTKETYNRIAKDWAKDHESDVWWIEGTDKFLSFLQKGNSILDVGCGAGHKSKYFADRGFGVVGIDFSEEMVKISSEHLLEGIFFVKDVHEPLGFEKSFDAVFAQAVLLHVAKKDINAILENLLTVLKQGGYLYVAVKETRPGDKEEEIATENDYGYEYERFFSYFTMDELRGYLSNAGLEVIYETITVSGKKNWIQVVAQK